MMERNEFSTQDKVNKTTPTALSASHRLREEDGVVLPPRTICRAERAGGCCRRTVVLVTAGGLYFSAMVGSDIHGERDIFFF